MYHAVSANESFQLPAVLEVRLESFRSTAGSDPPAMHGKPHLLLLLADGSLLAYQAYARGEGDVGFARMHLPLLPAYAGNSATASRPSASARMTRFDGLGDGTGLFYRCGSSRFRFLSLLDTVRRNI